MCVCKLRVLNHDEKLLFPKKEEENLQVRMAENFDPLYTNKKKSLLILSYNKCIFIWRFSLKK